jgi:hypothetical protein
MNPYLFVALDVAVDVVMIALFVVFYTPLNRWYRSRG